MVIDTSAVLAMLFYEPECRSIAQAIDRDSTRLISAVSIFEATMVAVARLGPDGLDELDLLLARIGALPSPFGVGDLGYVRDAFSRFGKGRHSAALNFGDCFSYALAVSTRQPLLFKGDDFSQTDIARVEY